MTNISDLYSIKNRFLRSIQLERDFVDPSATKGYVVTDFARQCFELIQEGEKAKSTRRAWRITGDYGSGKSSFALFLAHIFSGDTANPTTNRRKSQNFTYTPVLCTCSRRSLALSILAAFSQTLRANGLLIKSSILQKIDSFLLAEKDPSEKECVEILESVNAKLIESGKSRGILLVLDEVGKFLEYAAVQSDVFLLQCLAEAAARSGDHPLFLVCLLHQGFNEYAHHLPPSDQREWEKVAGRFDEIAFNQPLEQIAQLIVASLNVRIETIPKKLKSQQCHAMREALKSEWFGPAGHRIWNDLALHFFPLHPTTIPVLVQVFRRFGQGERSLFSFLLSEDPYGLQSYSSHPLATAVPFRLHNLYDYVRSTFGHRLALLSYRSHWNLIESVIENYTGEDILHREILKTIGLINLLNSNLFATEEALISCLNRDEHGNDRTEKVKSAIRFLQGKRIIFNRGRDGGYCLWPYTSVDIEKAYNDARKCVPKPTKAAAVIVDDLDDRPIVARRHYIETGNLRYFSVTYCSALELSAVLQNLDQEADGNIVVPLCETLQERKEVINIAVSEQKSRKANCLIAVSEPLKEIGALTHIVKCWEYVAEHTKELNGDTYAREEVSRQIMGTRLMRDSAIDNSIGLRKNSGTSSIEWFYEGKRCLISNGKEFLAKLSTICEQVYPLSPCVKNELVNRANLSSAAAAARMRLIERMFTSGHLPFLGMNAEKKPPEMSVYMSLLQYSTIHRCQNGVWQIKEPETGNDPCRLMPVMIKIHKIINAQDGHRINIYELFAELRKPPYGIRDGIIPLLFAAYTVAHQHEIAFYKSGSFLREMDAVLMLELIKSPMEFEVQYCKIEGIRSEVIEKIAAVLKVERNKNHKTEFVEVVTALCKFVAQLPDYVRTTQKCSSTASQVKNAVLNARDPLKLLFEDLLFACGVESALGSQTTEKDIRTFVSVLRTSCEELRAVYPELIERIKKNLSVTLNLPEDIFRLRKTIQKRSEKILLGVHDAKLKTFCLRLADEKLFDTEWLESLASCLIMKPPFKWKDSDEDVFSRELSQISERFQNVESILFANRPETQDGVGVRVTITKADGTECMKVIHYTAEEKRTMLDIQKQMEKLIDENPRLALAAATGAIWKNIQKESSE